MMSAVSSFRGRCSSESIEAHNARAASCRQQRRVDSPLNSETKMNVLPDRLAALLQGVVDVRDRRILRHFEGLWSIVQLERRLQNALVTLRGTWHT